MIIETRVLIVARLAEIGQELDRLRDLPRADGLELAKTLRAERRKLMDQLAFAPESFEGS